MFRFPGGPGQLQMYKSIGDTNFIFTFVAGGGISIGALAAGGPVATVRTMGQIAPSLGDDVLINLGSQARNLIRPELGRSYWFRWGEIKHLTPDQLRTLIGQMARAGTKEGSKVIRVAKEGVSARRVPCTEGYFEYVIDGTVKVVQSIPIP